MNFVIFSSYQEREASSSCVQYSPTNPSRTEVAYVDRLNMSPSASLKQKSVAQLANKLDLLLKDAIFIDKQLSEHLSY